MSEFTKRRGSNSTIARFLLTGGGLIALFFITLGAVRASWDMYGKFSQASQSNEEAQTNLTELKSKEAKIGTAVAALQSDRGVEAQVRQTYGVAKPGEGEIQIVRDSTSTDQINTKNSNFFGQIWQALFGWI